MANKTLKTAAGLLAGTTLLAAATLNAGVVYEIETTDYSGSRPEPGQVQTSIQDQRMKMNFGSRGNDGEMLYHSDRREMIMVDHEERSFIVIDREAIAEIGAKMNEANRMMADALKNVPPGQREAMERMLRQRMPQQAAPAPRKPVDLIKTGETATHNGYPCVKYEVAREGRTIRELWITDWDNVEGSEDAAEAFKGMAEFFGEMMEALPQFGPRGGPAVDENFFEHMNQMDGFPVVTREFDADGSVSGESTLRSVERRTLDPAEFEPPAGYKRRSLMPR